MTMRKQSQANRGFSTIRRIAVLLLAVVVVGITATVAFASPAHPQWQYANSSLSSNGQTLSVDFKEVGLGSQYTSDLITLSATVTADWGCFTKSGNHPQAENKEGPGTVSNTQEFQTRNGSITDTISLSIGSTLTCPSGQRLRLISATYDDITIHGTAGDFPASPSSLSYPPS
jgi:hypothetical protein